jgi:DNA repair protein RecO
MSIDKTACLVLSVMPYRETSAIAALLSRAHGRTSGIAKGVRGPKRAALTLERGLIIEVLLYVKQHRELNTMADPAVVAYFPSIRADLGKLALRDAAFEVVLRTAAASEAHPELFDFTLAFLNRLEEAAAQPPPLFLLWDFLCGWTGLMGFSLNAETCLRCGEGRIAETGGTLATERGGFVCPRCPGGRPGASFIPGAVIRCLTHGEPHGKDPCAGLSMPERMRITRLLADYCRYHLDIRGELKAVGFIEGVLGEKGR